MNIKEVVNDGVYAFLENYVLYAIYTWSFEGFMASLMSFLEKVPLARRCLGYTVFGIIGDVGVGGRSFQVGDTCIGVISDC